VRDVTRCTRCGRCLEVRRFHAVSETFDIDPYLCEGCGACVTVSPADALSLSGLHDLERALDVVRHFRIPAYLAINKADLSVEPTERVERFAADHELPVLGRIPYDRAVSSCLVEGESAVEQDTGPAGAAIHSIYRRLIEASARSASTGLAPRGRLFPNRGTRAARIPEPGYRRSMSSSVTSG